MKRKFNLNQLKKLHTLSKEDLRCIKGGKKAKNKNKNKNKKGGAGIPPGLGPMV